MAESDSKPYGVIYLVTNKVTGKVYVGQTIMSLAARWKGHCNAGKSSRLWLSIQAHGRENFTVEQIDAALDKQELDNLERFYIAVYEATNKETGYNFERGGAGVPKSKDATERAAAKLRGRKLPVEQREKIAARKRGVKHTKAHVQNMIASKIGYKHSAEAREKMSLASLGKRMPPCTPEHRAKLSKAAKEDWARRKAQKSIAT